jgi:hypothetical protein
MQLHDFNIVFIFNRVVFKRNAIPACTPEAALFRFVGKDREGPRDGLQGEHLKWVFEALQQESDMRHSSTSYASRQSF